MLNNFSCCFNILNTLATHQGVVICISVNKIVMYIMIDYGIWQWALNIRDLNYLKIIKFKNRLQGKFNKQSF